MARGTKVKSSGFRIPVREEKRPVVTPIQPAGFDMPRAQPAAAPAAPIVKQKEPVMVPIKQEPISSLVSPFDTQVDPFVSTVDTNAQAVEETEERAGTPTSIMAQGPEGQKYFQGIRSQDYGTGPKYDTSKEALSNYGSFFSEITEQQDQTASLYNYTNFDPGDFARAGFSGPSAVGELAASDKIVDYIQKNNIPLTKTIDGKKYYLTTGNLSSYKELFGRDQFVGGDLISSGPVGTYSTVFQKDENLVTSLLSDPIIGIAANFIPGGTLALTGAKSAAGIKLSPVEIASGLMAGLETVGAIKAPSTTSLPSGQVGPPVPTAGTGLFGTTYAQTQTALNAAAAGNAEGAALALVGQPLINNALDSVGLTEDVITGAGIQYDDLQEGIGRAVAEVAGGAELDDALAAGVGKYISEGGSLGIDLPDGPDIDLGIIEDVVRDVVRPIGAAGTALADFVEDTLGGIELSEGVKEVGRAIDDQVLQPIKEVAETTGSAIEDVVRAGGSAVDDAIIQPVREVAKDVDDAVIQPVGDALSALDTAVREVAPEIEDAVREIVNPLDNFVDDINLPDVDLPDFSLPNINISLPGLGQGMGLLSAALMPQPATATTNKIFDNELFKFKTKIGITDRDAPIDIEDFLTSPFESSFAQTGRF
jgi:hypothetical protein